MRTIYAILCFLALGWPTQATAASHAGTAGLKNDIAIHKVAQRSAIRQANRSGAIHKAPDDVITDAPGTDQLYFRDVAGFGISFDGMPLILEGTGVAQKIRTNGDDIYMYSPSFSFPTDSWIKGSFTDEGMEFALPQTILSTVEGDEEWSFELNYELNIFELVHDDDFGDYYDIPESDVPNSIILKKQEDGSYGYEPEIVECYDAEYEEYYNLPKYIVAVTISYDPEDYYPEWTFYGDFFDNLTLFEQTPVEAPADLKLDDWTVVSNGHGHTAQVGFAGNDVYFKGLFPTMPEAWLKGSVDGNQVVIPCGQYIGVNEDQRAFCFFYAGKMETWFDEELWTTHVEMERDENAILSYDVKALRMNTEQGFALFTSEEAVASTDNLPTPTIMVQPANISKVPESPKIIDYVEYGRWGNYAMVEFTTSTLNDEHYWIGSSANFSYRIISDGKPVIFAPGDDYPGIEEEMEWIPYDFTDYWSIQIDPALVGDKDQHIVSFHVESKEYSALQARYVDPTDGTEYVGQPTVFWGEMNGIGDVEASGNEALFFNLQGMPVKELRKGQIAIKVVDGKAVKTVIR